MQKNVKTNAMRALEALNIPYTVHTYSLDENNLDAVHAAKEAGLEEEKVYKTIVLKNTDNNLFVFCLPAGFEISLKKVKAITDSKDIDLLKMSDLQKYTGYIRGGCSPLAMIHKYPTFIEEIAQLEDIIYISAGVRGMSLGVKPEDLLRATDAEFVDFTK